jgi:hypothetical protein
MSFATLPDGWMGLRTSLTDPAVIMLTLGGVALIAVSGFLAYRLGATPNPRARGVGGLFGLLALGIVVALVTWWTVGIDIARQVAVALWDFGGGLAGVLVMGGSGALIAVFCLLAYRLRDTQGWTSALFGAMAVLLGLWWLIGIIPSAWVYFVDSQRELLAGQVIPSAITIGGLDVASNFYNVVRDSFVMVEGGIVLGAGVVLMFVIQRRFPRGMSEGEERGPTSGGYK